MSKNPNMVAAGYKAAFTRATMSLYDQYDNTRGAQRAAITRKINRLRQETNAKLVSIGAEPLQD